VQVCATIDPLLLLIATIFNAEGKVRFCYEIVRT
jgi:hypothetical protein